MSKKIILSNITVYSLAHALVDATCAATLFAIVTSGRYDSQNLVQLILIYDVIAFSTQPVFGLLVDKFKAPAQTAALGILLVAASTLMLRVPLLAAVTAGIGNAIFHVGGGVVSLNLTPGKATLPGIYVAPGALGLTIGIMIGKGGGFIAWPYLLLLLGSAVLILRIPRPEFPAQRELSGNLRWFETVIVLLLLSVVIRSLVGQSLVLPWKSDPALLLALTMAIVLGKASGGFLADRYGRDMLWPEVARRYMESFEKARQERRHQSRPVLRARTLDREQGQLPVLDLAHLQRLTDDTGLMQHAIFSVPNYAEGYTTDDNARALILTILLEELNREMPAGVEPLASRYLAFLWHAFNTEARRFRNFFAYERRWLEDIGSEDSHGRALWSLGFVLGRSQNQGLRDAASRLFELALPTVSEFTSPRAWAFSLVAVHEYFRRFSGDRVVQDMRVILAERLLALYERCHTDNWLWFEDSMSYANALLPQALLLCGQWLERSDMAEVGLTSLKWLAELQRSPAGHFVPIGSDGFYQRNGTKARFDQQPIEASTMISACLEAYRMTGDESWYQEARRSFEWFLGRNDLGLSLYDPTTGGCRDGLHPDRVNRNQGAESTLAFLLARVEMQLAENVIKSSTAKVGASSNGRSHFGAVETDRIASGAKGGL